MINFMDGIMNLGMRSMISRVFKLVLCLFQMLISSSLLRTVATRKNSIGLNQDGHMFKGCRLSIQDGGLVKLIKDSCSRRFQCNGTGLLKLITLKELPTVIG